MGTFQQAADILQANDFLHLNYDQPNATDAIFCLPGQLGRHPRYTSLPIDADPIPDSVLTQCMETALISRNEWEHLLEPENR